MHLAKTLTTGTLRRYARSCLSCPAENNETITNSGDGDSTTRTAVCNLAVSTHDAHTEWSTIVRKAGNNGFEAYDIPEEQDAELVESLHFMQLAKCTQLKELLFLYTQDLTVTIHLYRHFASREQQHTKPLQSRRLQRRSIVAVGSNTGVIF